MKRIIIAGNDIACGNASPIRFACKGSTSNLRDYTTPIVLSLLLHVAQIVFVVSMSIAIITVVPLVWFVWIVFEPQTAALPAVLAAGAAGIFFITIAFIYTIAYHAYFFSKIGLVAFLPVIPGIVTFGLLFIPLVGMIIAVVASLVPWMTVAVLYHQKTYTLNDTKVIVG